MYGSLPINHHSTPKSNKKKKNNQINIKQSNLNPKRLKKQGQLSNNYPMTKKDKFT